MEYDFEINCIHNTFFDNMSRFLEEIKEIPRVYQIKVFVSVYIDNV